MLLDRLAYQGSITYVYEIINFYTAITKAIFRKTRALLVYR